MQSIEAQVLGLTPEGRATVTLLDTNNENLKILAQPALSATGAMIIPPADLWNSSQSKHRLEPTAIREIQCTNLLALRAVVGSHII